MEACLNIGRFLALAPFWDVSMDKYALFRTNGVGWQSDDLSCPGNALNKIISGDNEDDSCENVDGNHFAITT